MAGLAPKTPTLVAGKCYEGKVGSEKIQQFYVSSVEDRGAGNIVYFLVFECLWSKCLDAGRYAWQGWLSGERFRGCEEYDFRSKVQPDSRLLEGEEETKFKMKLKQFNPDLIESPVRKMRPVSGRTEALAIC